MVTVEPCTRLRSYAGSSWTSADTVVTVPATPIQVPIPSSDQPSPSSNPSTYAVAAARAAGATGPDRPNRSVSRTEPMSSDTA